MDVERAISQEALHLQIQSKNDVVVAVQFLAGPGLREVDGSVLGHGGIPVDEQCSEG